MNYNKCKFNTKQFIKQNKDIKSSLYENMRDNNSKRMDMQFNDNKYLKIQMEVYDEVKSCCDCHSLPYNKGYSCSNLINKNLKR